MSMYRVKDTYPGLPSSMSVLFPASYKYYIRGATAICEDTG